MCVGSVAVEFVKHVDASGRTISTVQHQVVSNLPGDGTDPGSMPLGYIDPGETSRQGLLSEHHSV